MSPDEQYVAEYARPDEAPKDGIGEEDHPIPAWWWWTFLGTVAFAAFYVPYYAMTGWSQERQYAEEVQRIEALRNAFGVIEAVDAESDDDVAQTE